LIDAHTNAISMVVSGLMDILPLYQADQLESFALVVGIISLEDTHPTMIVLFLLDRILLANLQYDL